MKSVVTWKRTCSSGGFTRFNLVFTLGGKASINGFILINPLSDTYKICYVAFS